MDNKIKYDLALRNLKMIDNELEELSSLYDDCFINLKKNIIIDDKTIEEDLFKKIIKENDIVRKEIKYEVLNSLKEKI